MSFMRVFTPQNKNLVTELVRTDFKLRYQGSVLGYAWSLLRPLMLFVILYIVFVGFLRIGDGVPNFPIYLLLGIVLWTFFAETTSAGLTAITSRGDMIKKVRVPKWSILIASSISTSINLGLNLLVVAVFMVVSGVEPSVGILLLPVILLEIYVLALGLSLILSAAYVRFRDISYVWEVVLQAGFYITPILYPLTLITNPLFQKIIFLNPMAQAIQDARFLIVTDESITLTKSVNNDYWLAVPVIITISALVIGVLFFKSQSKNFAENL